MSGVLVAEGFGAGSPFTLDLFIGASVSGGLVAGVVVAGVLVAEGFGAGSPLVAEALSALPLADRDWVRFSFSSLSTARPRTGSGTTMGAEGTAMGSLGLSALPFADRDRVRPRTGSGTTMGAGMTGAGFICGVAG